MDAALEQALRDLALKTAEIEERLADIAWTAAVKRSHHEHRLALVARTPDELAGRLKAFARGEVSPAFCGSAHGPGPPNCGQDSRVSWMSL